MTTHSDPSTAAARAPAKGKSARARAAAPTPPKQATALTTSINAKVAATIPPWDQDPERPFATARLLYAFPDDFEIPGTGTVYPAWSLKAYSRFLDPDNPAKAPPSVNPSLWRNALLNMNAGLYEVVPDAVYQVRGADLSNISFLEDPTGKTGDVVVVDPLVSEECAAEALSTYLRLRADGIARTITAVIYTHSHVDHYGGVRGLFGPKGPGPEVQFIAPEDFLDHAVSENVYAGAAMSRRAVFMYGVEMPRDILGQVDAGLGKNTSTGTTGIIAPTVTISKDTSPSEPFTVGNIEFVFQLTPNTEAPAEMNFYLPQCRALCMAENATPTMHNIYSLRGAQVRDAKAWSEYLNDAAATFGPITDTLFASHFWPRWNDPEDPDSSVIADFLTSQADLYRFLHDQTLRLSNEGSTMLEVAEELDQNMPPSLADQWFNHGYYGTVNHNVKAVYQRYLGWFDGNPPHLHSLPPQQLGQRYVNAMGGPEKALAIAKDTFLNATSVDDYRWAAQLASDVVFGWPQNNTAARELEADVLEQLGYLAESGPWRNFYLAGALELRVGDPPARLATMITPDMIAAMSLKQVFDYFGIRLNAVKYEIIPLSIGLAVTGQDGAESTPCWLRTRNSVVVFKEGAPEGMVDASYEITRDGLNKMALGTASPKDLVASGELKVLYGVLDSLTLFYGYLDSFVNMFPIAIP